MKYIAKINPESGYELTWEFTQKPNLEINVNKNIINNLKNNKMIQIINKIINHINNIKINKIKYNCTLILIICLPFIYENDFYDFEDEF